MEVLTTDGEVMTETDRNSSIVTTWTVTPDGQRCRVRIETRWRGARGIGGFFERLFAPRVMRKIYAVAKQSSAMRIVFPEGENDAVLRAAQICADESLCRPILLGRPDFILDSIADLCEEQIYAELVSAATPSQQPAAA